MSERLPIKYAWLTLLVALTTFGLKAVAAWLTNSVGLFSDALESVVNLTTALLLLWLLRIADQPPDEDHPYGHEKAEYFANGVQGTLILLAGVGIVSSALERFLKPVAVSDQGVGLALAFAAGVFNLVFAQVLIRKGRSFGSEGLKGEGEHLMSDVWTTVAVLLGVGLAIYTGKLWLDPLAAIGVSLVVFATGARLLKSFVSGLMDTSLPESEHAKLHEVLDRYRAERGTDFHAIRTRRSGARRFVSFHVLVPGAWTVSKGHELLDELEAEVSQALDGKVTVLTHLEPIEEECSFADIDL